MTGKWEEVAEYTHRLKVPNGYLYRVMGTIGSMGMMTVTFVPTSTP